MTSTSDTVVTSRTREQWADNLRVVAIVGVIVVHTATGYLVDIPWYYEEERVTSGLWSTVLSFPVYAGGLFWLGPLFLVAGWFSVRSLAHRGPGGFACSRLLRLGVPLLVFVLLLQPLTDWVGNLRSEKGASCSTFGRPRCPRCGSSRRCWCSPLPMRAFAPYGRPSSRPAGTGRWSCSALRPP